MPLIRLSRDWSWPNLCRQTPHSGCTWGQWHFTEEEVPDCDGVLVLNRLIRRLTTRCPADNVWALMQEPDEPGIHDWMREGHDCFARVFTHAPVACGMRYVGSHPAVPWHVGRSYDELVCCGGITKSPSVVWVTSDLALTVGHRKRMALLRHLERTAGGRPSVEIFGRGIRPVADKWDVLAPAMYAMALESAQQNDYWTEKIADCFLAETLPLYWGCPNIGDYFPEECFIRIDPDQPETVAALLLELPQSGEWQRRRKALGEARRLVLEKYQFFPWVSGLLDRCYQPGPAVPLSLAPWRPALTTRARNFRRRWRRRIHRFAGGISQ